MRESDFLSRLLGRSAVREEEELQTLDDLGASEYPSSPIKVTDADFDQVIQRFPPMGRTLASCRRFTPEVTCTSAC